MIDFRGKKSPYFIDMRKEDIIMFVSQVVENHGFFVVEVKITPQGKLLIFMDGLAQKVTIDDCVKVSRTILEQHEEIAEQYGIEVSSPGLENPFKVQEQYTKNIGNLVSVLLKDGKKYQENS